jgi:hypothetical protein
MRVFQASKIFYHPPDMGGKGNAVETFHSAFRSVMFSLVGNSHRKKKKKPYRVDD